MFCGPVRNNFFNFYQISKNIHWLFKPTSCGINKKTVRANNKKNDVLNKKIVVKNSCNNNGKLALEKSDARQES